VVVNARDQARDDSPPVRLGERAQREVIWHDLECGCYRADLPLWRELARAAGADARHGRILEVGAGTGRVALDLARAGHAVTALDCDPALLDALRQRAGQLEVEVVCADARAFELSRHDFGLCIVPMQTIQLLGGSAGRLAFLRRARTHLRRGGLLACTIATALEPFDCARGDTAPSPEMACVGELRYVSRATRVSVRRRNVLIERERQIITRTERGADGVSAARGDGRGLRSGGRDSGGEGTAERSVVRLDRVDVARLEREAIEAGLRPEPTRQVAPTEEHTGSTVVMLRA
jgi:SAM-dependent methyltransferase